MAARESNDNANPKPGTSKEVTHNNLEGAASDPEEAPSLSTLAQNEELVDQSLTNWRGFLASSLNAVTTTDEERKSLELGRLKLECMIELAIALKKKFAIWRSNLARMEQEYAQEMESFRLSFEVIQKLEVDEINPNAMQNKDELLAVFREAVQNSVR